MSLSPSSLGHVTPQVGSCFCVDVDRSALRQELTADLGPGTAERLATAESTWFSQVPVFVPESQLAATRSAVDVLWRATQQLADARGQKFQGTSGVLHGFDFHLTAQGPRLIEINTNAGGVLLALRLAQAQVACCDEIAQRSTDRLEPAAVERRLLEMFHQEWRLARPGASRDLQSIIIVDAEPEQQGLYPEMQLYRGLFERNGLRAAVADPSELTEDSSGQLLHGEQSVDLVYNRLTDFMLNEPRHAHLRRAWQQHAVVLTPNPDLYEKLADKRRLVELSSTSSLERAGIASEDRNLLLELTPACEVVSNSNADRLWSERKRLFFKPVQGFGSRGAYDGRKLTRRTFGKMLGPTEANDATEATKATEAATGAFLAQARVEPSKVTALVDGEVKRLKVDLRAVVYDGEVVFFLARLYRGQTTNLRTAGGGLATVFPAPG